MKNSLLLSLFLCFSFALLGQHYDLRLVPLINEGIVGGDYQVKVQIRSSGSPFKMGSSNIRLRFNNNGLSPLANPILLAHNMDSGSSANYAAMTSMGSRDHLLSLNIELQNTNQGTTVGTDWLDLASLGFLIDDTNQFSELSFSNTQIETIVFADNQNTLLLQQQLTGLNQPLDATILPVEWLHFDVKVSEQHTKLHWITGSEWNNDYFEVQHASDGLQWSVIGHIAATNQGSSENHYSFLHESPSPGSNYYRLRQVDNDQHFTFSQILLVELHEKPSFVVYPNPTSDFIFLSTQGWEQNARLLLFNQQGKFLYEQPITSALEQISLLNFPAGTLYLRVISLNKDILHQASFQKY